MKKLSNCFILFLFLMGCVEPYDFVISDTSPRLVVEGFISDKSYDETLAYPSDGQRFSIKLSYTSDVTNSRSKPVQGAYVRIVDDLGNLAEYVEMTNGEYMLWDGQFKALEGRKYKLLITAGADQEFESTWESLPTVGVKPMGTIGFEETKKLLYKYESKEKVLKNVDGIEANIELPSHDESGTVFYKWDFTPTWIFIAPLTAPPAIKKCWVNSQYFLSGFTLMEDYHGGYKKGLFFIETIDNEKVWEKLSVLVRQQVLSKDYFFFLKELQEQTQGGVVADKPPFNLATNMTATSGDIGVVGYFGVVKENATRWYFSTKDLSYPVPNRGLETCTGIPPFEPPPGCHSCMAYPNGQPTNVQPWWWEL